MFYNRCQWIFILVLLFAIILSGSCNATQTVEPDYYRIVLLGDSHLPIREREIPDTFKQGEIIQAKQQLIDDINGWTDVTCVVALGDITAQFGNEKEYAYARDYFNKFIKPVYLITGNHDYIYAESFSAEGRFVLGDRSSRERKLERFKETFRQKDLFYSQHLGDYFLVFLSVDALDSSHLAQMSETQLAWLRQELEGNRMRPTIIFFHAPLKGTLSRYNKFADTPNFIAQPEKDLQNIIEDNPQIILWVSGHVHVSAGNPNFSSPINFYNSKVLNVHNSDLDRKILWTNSLYLYKDAVIIKTFNHNKQEWMEMDRSVYSSAGR